MPPCSMTRVLLGSSCFANVVPSEAPPSFLPSSFEDQSSALLEEEEPMRPGTTRGMLMMFGGWISRENGANVEGGLEVGRWSQR